MMTLTKVLLFIILGSNICFGQLEQTTLEFLDSVKVEFSQSRNYSDSVEQALMISTKYLYVNPDSAIKYGMLAQDLAVSNGDDFSRLFGMGLTGEALIYRGELVQSLDMALEALVIHDQQIAKGVEHTYIGPNWYNLSEIYYLLGKYDQSEKYANLLSTEVHADDQIGIAFGYYLLARSKIANNNIDGAIRSIEDAKVAFKEVPNPELGNIIDGAYPGIYNLEAEIFIKQSKPKEALKLYKKLLDQSDQYGESFHSAVTSLDIAELYDSLGEQDSVLKYAHKGLNLSNQISYTLGQLRSNNILASGYSEKQPAEAISYYQNAAAIQEDVYGFGNIQLMRDMVDEKEQQQRELENANRASQQNRKQLIFIFSLITFAALASLFYYNSRKMKKVNLKLERSFSDLKSTQAQLIQSEKMASLGELTAGIAHEIQNPLNFVNNFSDVSGEMIEEISEELENGDIKEVKEILNDLKGNLEKIHHHGGRASGIVRSMLDHSRTSSTDRAETDINALCDEYIRLAYHGLRAKDRSFNAEFKTAFDESLPKIKVATQDIGRVVLNILNNAFYAVNQKKKGDVSDSYNPAVKIKTTRLKGRHEGIQITISDNGIGMSAETLEKVFQPFYTTKPTGQGTGLGMSLAYDIVKAHGGSINLESKEGEGTTFIIILPKDS